MTVVELTPTSKKPSTAYGVSCAILSLKTIKENNMIRSPWMSSSYQKKEGLKKLVRVIEEKKYTVLLNPEIGSWAVLNEEDIVRYDSNTLNEIEMEALYLRGLALDDTGEIVDMEFPKPAEYPSVVVVNITTVCNLKCKYCFADCTPDTGEYMEDIVMERTISQLFEMPSPLITFELQGGEPLCYLEGMKRFIEIAEELRIKYDKRVQYRTVTNCTLITKEFVELAKKYDIKVGISLDGPKELNDGVRIDENGNGSFDKIMKGISLMKEHGIDVDGAVCTIGQHNYFHPEEIVDFFAENNISFKPRPANILGREIQSKTTTQKGQWKDTYERMYHRSKLKGIENFAIHIFEENVYTPIRDYICLRYPCGAAREIISVNPNGEVYPCDGFKGEEKFIIGNIKDENLADMLKKDWVKTLRNRTSKDINKCNSCLFKAMCCSCCYSAYGEFGTVYREDPHCFDRRKIFEFLLDEWIKNNVI